MSPSVTMDSPTFQSWHQGSNRRNIIAHQSTRSAVKCKASAMGEA